jgi:hypothetical protein
MSLHGIKVRILKTDMDSDATEILQADWVKIYGVPAIALKEEVIMKIASQVGDPILVDELSLIKASPVRVKMYCRDPTKLRGFVKIFFNRVGYEVIFIVEKYKDNVSFPPSPPDGKKEFRDDEEEDGDESEEEDSDIKHKRSTDQMLGARGDSSTLKSGSQLGKGTQTGLNKRNIDGVAPLDTAEFSVAHKETQGVGCWHWGMVLPHPKMSLTRMLGDTAGDGVLF